ncbi:unnamed protein product [Callosobruchus maculatus]|uniref:Uncharacterized protein n=1 Tax=Callosobruchus maculatus TaxID=64391 RepID=A0A653D7G8_CALMS|nr:unnamed protein product [Callosobruchus maculatus]
MTRTQNIHHKERTVQTNSPPFE